MEPEYKVVFSPEANQAIQDRADYIMLQTGSTITASRYMDGVYSFCESLSMFPRRNIRRDDLYPGLYITIYRATTIIAYEVDEDAKIVHIADVFHSRQDYENLISPA